MTVIFGYIQISGGIHGYAKDAQTDAAIAGPPSPFDKQLELKRPASVLPTTAVIAPSAETR
jgi:hypothetical protein